jgi:putative restriction endonuclease
MTIDAILTRFDELNTWRQGNQRAPHKPLLVLYALGWWQQGKLEVTYAEAEPDVTTLLREFGPPRKSDHPEQPFWRLQRDGVWTGGRLDGRAGGRICTATRPDREQTWSCAGSAA